MKIIKRKNLEIPAHLKKAEEEIRKAQAAIPPKPKPRKAKDLSTSGLPIFEDADFIGGRYKDLSSKISGLEKEAEIIKDNAKALADSKGSQKGKRVTVRGKKFEVGYLLVDLEPVIDVRKAQKVIHKDIFKQCLKPPELDPKKVADHVNRGNIDVTRLKPCLNMLPPQRRVYVSKINYRAKQP